MRMCNYRQFIFVGLINNCFDFFQCHLILIDEFDDIHSGFCKFLNFRTRIGNTFDTPTS